LNLPENIDSNIFYHFPAKSLELDRADFVSISPVHDLESQGSGMHDTSADTQDEHLGDKKKAEILKYMR